MIGGAMGESAEVQPMAHRRGGIMRIHARIRAGCHILFAYPSWMK